MRGGMSRWTKSKKLAPAADVPHTGLWDAGRTQIRPSYLIGSGREGRWRWRWRWRFGDTRASDALRGLKRHPQVGHSERRVAPTAPSPLANPAHPYPQLVTPQVLMKFLNQMAPTRVGLVLVCPKTLNYVQRLRVSDDVEVLSAGVWWRMCVSGLGV